MASILLKNIDYDEDEDSRNEDTSEHALYIKALITKSPFASVFVIVGIALLIIGLSSLRSQQDTTLLIDNNENESIVVEISGAIVTPGVYELEAGTRIISLIDLAGGLSDDADTQWITKTLNLASELQDGQKIYIPSQIENNQLSDSSAKELPGDQTVSSDTLSQSEEKVNINTSSALELETLWGIGRITAQNIIDHRPYSTVDQLVETGVLKKNVYERNKDILTVY